MKKMKSFLLVFLTFLFAHLFFGCKSMVVDKNPDVNLSHYRRIVVYAHYDNIDERSKMESSLVESFTEIGITTLRSMDLFDISRQYSNAELTEILKVNDIDGYLAIHIKSVNTHLVVIPPTTRTEYTTIWNGNHPMQIPRTVFVPGYSYYDTDYDVEFVLTDVETGRNSFRASTLTDSTKSARVARTLAREIAREFAIMAKEDEESLGE
ncbi:MAG: hypothetical protein IK002_04625 [Treponema sp.]|uniref:hypothetical protein n=1 Tax=Treponema sp. TaxID=166 RepID=UPI00298D65B7|nr:hypothetical protein [Treponema sp.]MBR5933253.1 hypothetical protein [Treponema sp.]